MGRIVAYVPDLLFGSSVLASLQAAGHEAQLLAQPSAADVEDADLLVIDLTADAGERLAMAGKLRRAGLRTLAFYSHVDVDVRRQAQDAGIDLVVPRSRMAREGAALVASLVR